MTYLSKAGHNTFTTCPSVEVWLVATAGVVPDARVRSLQPAYAAGRPDGTADRRERLAATAALVLLGGGAADGWTREDGGRPVSPTGRSVSLSHVAGLAAVAVAPAGVRVGVDVERERRIGDLYGLARTAMAAPELASWAAGEPDDARLRFLRRWVRKEAVLKATGEGLAGDLRAVDVGDDGRIAGLPPAAGPSAAWTVADLAIDRPDTVAALAVKAARPRIVLHQITIDDLLETHRA